VAQFGASKILIVPKYHQADQIKENEAGGAWGIHGRRQKVVQGFGGKARRKETTWKTRRRWKDDIRNDLGEIGWGSGFSWLRIATGGGLL
jgi:hypothetical protein